MPRRTGEASCPPPPPRWKQDTLDRLDPRAPLVLDTRELGRRPGSMRRVSRAVPAPPDLGIADVIGVPPGEEVELDLRLEAVMEGVLVSGHAAAAVTGECVRCLDPVARRVEVDLQELYRYPDLEREEDEGEELPTLQGDLIDIEPALRDAIVLELPLKPLCDETCPGLCVDCGARLAEDPGHHHEAMDPRWASLAGILDGGGAQGGARRDPTTDSEK